MIKEVLIEVADLSYNGMYNTAFMLFTNLDSGTKQLAFKLGIARKGLCEPIDVYVRDFSYRHELEEHFEDVCELLRQNESQIKFVGGTDCSACDAPITLSRPNQISYNNYQKAKFLIFVGTMAICYLLWVMLSTLFMLATNCDISALWLILCGVGALLTYSLFCAQLERI